MHEEKYFQIHTIFYKQGDILSCRVKQRKVKITMSLFFTLIIENRAIDLKSS